MSSGWFRFVDFSRLRVRICSVYRARLSSDSFCFSTAVFFNLFFSVLGSEAQSRLIRHMFQDYDKLSRPVDFMEDVVQVQFGLTLNILVYVVGRMEGRHAD